MTEPLIRDERPNPMQLNACLPRLYEEIYLVDPILIVGLGAETAKVLMKGKKVGIVAENGYERSITITGAWHLPSRTEKRKAWGRKVRGSFIMPTVQNQVTYLMIPLIHPAYVLRNWADKRVDSPFDKFTSGMKKVAAIFNRYMTEILGAPPAETRD